MFTSRAEFRLHLRIDNADRRLTPYGRRVGLISDLDWEEFLAKQRRLDELKRCLVATRLTPPMLEAIDGLALTRASEPLVNENPSPYPASVVGAAGQTCAQLLKRPEISIEDLVPILAALVPEFFSREGAPPGKISSRVRNDLKSVETEIKYEGYLLQQQRAIDRLKKAEQRAIPEWFDYHSISGLSREVEEKLLRIRPRTLAHASAIPGITPAAVALVNVYIEIQAKRRAQSLTA
jgi:tRNA uridine 5-carboxymethylaminomethyl modification enzyme